MTEQLVPANVTEEHDVGTRGPRRTVLCERLQISTIPRAPDGAGKSVPFALHYLKDGGELLLEDQQPLVGDAWIDEDRAWGLTGVAALVLLDWIPDGPDQPLAGRQTAHAALA